MIRRGSPFLLTLITLAALLALSACENIRKRPGLLELVTGRPDVTLKAMSFNVRYANPGDGVNAWEHRRDLVVALIREQRPDVLGLQEPLAEQLRDLLAALPEYDAVGVGRDDGAEKGEYSPILFRRDRLALVSARTFWLSPTPEVPGSRGWGANLPRICTTALLAVRGEQRAIRVYNTHLDHQSAPARAQSAHLIARAIADDRAPGVPVLLTGDFNCGERDGVIGFLTGREESSAPGLAGGPPSPRLLDTYRVLSTQTLGTGTYHAFRGSQTGDRIDFIFADRSLGVLESAILPTPPASAEGPYPSDHYPITATVSLNGPKKPATDE